MESPEKLTMPHAVCSLFLFSPDLCLPLLLLVVFFTTVEALVAVASRPVGVTHIWALHGLWLVAGAAGVGYAAHVKQSLQLALELQVGWSFWVFSGSKSFYAQFEARAV